MTKTRNHFNNVWRLTSLKKFSKVCSILPKKISSCCKRNCRETASKFNMCIYWRNKSYPKDFLAQTMPTSTFSFVTFSGIKKKQLCFAERCHSRNKRHGLPPPLNTQLWRCYLLLKNKKWKLLKSEITVNGRNFSRAWWYTFVVLMAFCATNWRTFLHWQVFSFIFLFFRVDQRVSEDFSCWGQNWFLWLNKIHNTVLSNTITSFDALIYFCKIFIPS